MLRMIWRIVRGLVLTLVLVVASYLLAAVAGSAIAVNPGWKQAEAGVRIYVIDNGVHTDLVLPAVAEGVDWRELARPEDLADPAQAAQSHLAFGWGNRDFYLNTPSWSKMEAGRALGALAGTGSTVLHVAHMAEPRAAPHIRSVMLSAPEYRRLAAYVLGTFASRASVRGYGGNDAFYEAKGGYSAIWTCNQWTGGALRAAGVRMGAWTPFTFGVMRWL
jgi:uncharacterized protein (TIGR02117 family)